MNTPTAILFDLDGVLLDTEPLLAQAWKESANHFGIRITEAQLKELKGQRRIDCANKIIELVSFNIDIEVFIKFHKSKVINLIRYAKPIENANELINYCLRRDIPIALVTSSSKESFELKKQYHPWISSFNTKILGDSVKIKKGKPHPDPYLAAANELGADICSCWAIEDSIAGATSAIRAGCKLWLLNQDQEIIDELSKKTNYTNFKVIANLINIIEILEKK